MDLSVNQKNTVILLTVIICLVSITAYHGYYKEYLYEDEVLSYTIANSEEGAFFKLVPGNFYKGSELYSNLLVEKGHGFNYAEVISNHKSDAHPPLYGIVLHTICSIWDGFFSKWTGLGLNLMLYAVLLALIYFLILELFPERYYFSAFVCLVFGCTTGVIDLIIFIRKYVLLMLLTTGCIFWHIRFLRGRVSFTGAFILCLQVFAGAMTHYFYLIFVFFCGIFFLCYKVAKKEIKDSLSYIGAILTAGAAYLLLWHDVIFNIFILDAASDMVSQEFTVKLIISKTIQMVRNINDDLFGNRLKYLVFIILCFAVFLVFSKREQFKKIIHIQAELKFIIIVNIFFFISASAITPYMTTRYISPTFPFVILLTVLALEQVTNEVLRYQALGPALIFIFFCMPEFEVLREGLFDENRHIIDEVSSEQMDNPCLFSAEIIAEENIFELKKFDTIFIYNGENAADSASEISEAEEIVVYVPKETDPEEYVENVRTVNPALVNMDRLYVAYYSTAYLLHR